MKTVGCQAQGEAANANSMTTLLALIVPLRSLRLCVSPISGDPAVTDVTEMTSRKGAKNAKKFLLVTYHRDRILK